MPFSLRQPGCPPPADPQLSVSRLLGIWHYQGIIEKALKKGFPAPPKALFYCLGKFASIVYWVNVNSINIE
jgi:hypothetical protein